MARKVRFLSITGWKLLSFTSLWFIWSFHNGMKIKTEIAVNQLKSFENCDNEKGFVFQIWSSLCCFLMLFYFPVKVHVAMQG